MKRFVIPLIAALLIPAFAFSEEESGRKVPEHFPQFVKDAIKTVPEDAFVGVGKARFASMLMSQQTAMTRARAEISRQINLVILRMIRDYTVPGRADPSITIRFQEQITVSISKSTLTGCCIVDIGYDDNGECWVIVQMPRASVVEEIDHAQEKAPAAPAMAPFSTEERIDAAFNEVYREEIKVGG